MFTKIIVTAISLGSSFLMPLSSAATPFELRFGETFSGDSPSAAVTPWVTALFQDISPGTVRLTISNVNLTASENVDEFYFNLKPSYNPNSIVFTTVGTSGAFDAPTISKGTDLFKADGDGLYDLHLTFSTGGTDANRFTDNESLTYDLSGIPGLTAQDFVYESTPAGGHGPFYGAAHVQRIGISGSKSGWINPTGNMITPVPEPTAAALAVVGGGLFVGRRMRRVSARG
jgi:hypothetical protein